jgi:hypothetical protein
VHHHDARRGAGDIKSTFEAIAAVFAEYGLPGWPAGAPFGGRRMYGEYATRLGRSKLVESRYPLKIF